MEKISKPKGIGKDLGGNFPPKRINAKHVLGPTNKPLKGQFWSWVKLSGIGIGALGNHLGMEKIWKGKGAWGNIKSPKGLGPPKLSNGKRNP